MKKLGDRLGSWGAAVTLNTPKYLGQWAHSETKGLRGDKHQLTFFGFAKGQLVHIRGVWNLSLCALNLQQKKTKDFETLRLRDSVPTDPFMWNYIPCITGCLTD